MYISFFMLALWIYLEYLESCVASIKDWWDLLTVSFVSLLSSEEKWNLPSHHNHNCICISASLYRSLLSRLLSFFFLFLSPLPLKKSTLFILSKSLFLLVFSFQLNSAKTDYMISTYCVWILRCSTFLWNFVMKQINQKPKKRHAFSGFVTLEITLLKTGFFIFVISLDLFIIVGQLS